MAVNRQLHISRARKAWPILVKRVSEKKPTAFTYKELSDLIGVHWRAAGRYLSEIQEYCADQKLPRLQAFAVNGKTKVPGDGYKGARGKTKHAQEMAEVRLARWPKKAPF